VEVFQDVREADAEDSGDSDVDPRQMLQGTNPNLPIRQFNVGISASCQRTVKLIIHTCAWTWVYQQMLQGRVPC
jgi:hypothetical protein